MVIGPAALPPWFSSAYVCPPPKIIKVSSLTVAKISYWLAYIMGPESILMLTLMIEAGTVVVHRIEQLRIDSGFVI